MEGEPLPLAKQVRGGRRSQPAVAVQLCMGGTGGVSQRLWNHYAIKQLAFSQLKISGFFALGVAEFFWKSCDLHCKMKIPPSQEWKNYLRIL